ncbi:MIP family channel protein [Nocardioides jishulii]|uniref:MIP family channel protein n=1 Tax=Nocardioides jishulii TaxID=2575440 RepID=A0A4U2YTG3_9ACTN|nr:MIP family channel protein [Nocardioides jishulii]QCX28318.1 MIP family channel protein [Nocardioides jishulii]TKI64788.1 MIP family channel protein [Nocardioides jishulii]
MASKSQTGSINAQPTTGHKIAAEFIGTFALVLFGVGAALMSGGNYVATGFSFGLVVMVMAAAMSHISGGHFNPAVSFGAAVGGRLPWPQVPIYWASQLLGGILAGATLYFLMQGFPGYDVARGGLGQNGYGDQSVNGYEVGQAFVLETLMTLMFLWVILAVTDRRARATGLFAPTAIGMALTIIHFASMGATGTSVNPARSIGPALFVGVDAIEQLWLFVCAPLLGAAIAGVTYALLFGREPLDEADEPEEVDEVVEVYEVEDRDQ